MTTAILACALTAMTFAQDSCGSCKGEGKGEVDHHRSTPKDAFLMEAERMAMEAEGKKQCCKSTEAKPMAKGDPGCCNAKTAAAKFKVFANGAYQFFGCADSAAKARKEMLQKGLIVGKVQPVRTKSTRIG